MKDVAVIGAGYWGKNLARNFYEIGALNTICDRNELLSESYKTKYAGVGFTTDFSGVLKDPSIKAVAIATPAVTHYEMAKSALAAGKHVFVEKPLSLQVKQGEHLIELAQKAGRILMVGHILQYHNAILKLKELIDTGELGKVQYLCSNRLSIGKIRSEENILWSFAPHDISVILMLLGEEPEYVHATGGELLQTHVADVTLTTMSFPSGVKAHIFVSWLHPFKEQKLVVVGDKKMAVFDDISQEKLFLYPHQISWQGRAPVASKADAVPVPIEMKEPLKQECLHFIECFHNGKEPKTDGREGLRVLKVLQASQDSLDRKTADGMPLSTRHKQETSKQYFLHESSYIDDNVFLGQGTKVWHFSHILNNTVIGDNCNIGQNVVIGPDVKIGDRCKIQNNVSVYKGVTLEDEVFCGPSMVFTNIFNPRANIPRMHEVRDTYVKRGATIGANATIVCGHTIGAYAFIGAGAVVTNDVRDHALMAGNPAKQIGWMCKCGQKLEAKDKMFICKTCNIEYIQSGDSIKLLD